MRTLPTNACRPGIPASHAMRTLLLLAAVALVPIPVRAQEAADGPPADAPAVMATTIREVTVYPSEALVRRAGTVALTRGVTSVEIRDLPEVLRDDSVQVKTQGAGTVVGVDVRRVTSTAAVSPAVQALRDRKRGLDEQIADCRAAQDGLRTSRQFLDSLRAEAPKTSTTASAAPPDPAKWDEVLVYLEGAYAANSEAQRAETAKLEDLTARLREVEAQLQQLQRDLLVPTKRVVLDLLANGAGETSVEIAYLVGGASWAPAYDLRAAANLRQATLLTNAVVAQRTGEDWSGVTLVLSTAKPEQGAQPPSLQPIELSARSSAPARGRVASRKIALAEERRQDAPSESADDAADVLSLDAEVLSSGLSMQLRVPRPELVPADGLPHRVRVGEIALALAPVHVSVPKLATRAFVRANPKNTSSLPILAGMAQVFVGNDFVGRVSVPDTLPGEEMKLHVGADPGVTVERKQERADREAPGFLQSRVTWTFAYRITAKNVSAATGEATVEISESIPVSRDDRIRVEVTKSDPPFVRGEKEDKARTSDGTHLWKLTLKPGEERAIQLVYSVSAPEGLLLHGLDLR